jgi:hypothetical protein
VNREIPQEAAAMSRLKFLAALPLVATLAGITVGEIVFATVSVADDTPPSQTPDAPPPQGRHHNNPAWAACKQQADDKKLERGEERREFMKQCLNSSKNATPVAPPAT